MDEDKGASQEEVKPTAGGGGRNTPRGHHQAAQRGGQSSRGKGYRSNRGVTSRGNYGRGHRKQGSPVKEDSSATVGTTGDEQKRPSEKISSSDEGAGKGETCDLRQSEIQSENRKGDKSSNRGKSRGSSSKERISENYTSDTRVGTDDDKVLTKSKGKNRKYQGKQSESREQDQRSGRDKEKAPKEKNVDSTAVKESRSVKGKESDSSSVREQALKGKDPNYNVVKEKSGKGAESFPFNEKPLKGKGMDSSAVAQKSSNGVKETLGKEGEQREIQPYGGPLVQEVGFEGPTFNVTSRGSRQSNVSWRGQRGEPYYHSPHRRGQSRMNHNYGRRDEWLGTAGSAYSTGAGIYGFPDGTNGAYAFEPNYMHYQHPYDQYYVQNPFQDPFMQYPSWNNRGAISRGTYSSQYGYEPDYLHEQNRRTDHQFDQRNEVNKSPSTRKTSQNKRGKRFGRDLERGSTVQASALAEQLRNSSYECMVCCDTIKFTAPVWSCRSCYHIFHLRCAKRWAKSPAALVQGESDGWRCPACQNVVDQVPNVYKCFCGKVCDPVWNPRDGLTPHSCGELCHKRRESANQCTHPCNQLCHPGPCPSCPVMLTRVCACGKKKMQVRCGQSSVVVCKMVCDKLLNCGQHRCQATCHTGPCNTCEIQVQQSCYCGKEQRETFCGTGEPDCVGESIGCFSCNSCCNRTLDCGNHTCEKTCHPRACGACQLKPSVVTHCPCGKLSIAELLGDGKERQSCLDPVPLCEQLCNKLLPCSPDTDVASKEHRCPKQCHHGPCGTCDKITVLKCRCGATNKEIPCAEITSEAPLCEQRCNKKRQCGRHRCNQKCCVDTAHTCELICGKKLRCKMHKCEEFCHPGYCPPCLMSGFDELTCYCGASVLYPPISCGTPPPVCALPCSRQHSCPHPVFHTCHTDDTCPPCTVLTKKMCMGEHEMRLNIPCHVTDVSCGKPCGKTLPVCGHKCTRTCHKGPCLEEGQTCSQTCCEPRKECGHVCGALCHVGQACPTLPCKVKITISCKCGRRTDSVPCLQGGDRTALTQAYQRLATETLATRMKELQLGQSVEIGTIMKLDENKSRQIECNSDCAVFERNRRLAEALDISNPNLSPYSPPPYSPFLLSEAKHNLSFVKSVEECLSELVKTALKSSAPQRTHSFPPMNSNQRRIVHELAVLYNCSSRSYDSEPKRSTVVSATKESRIPSVSLAGQTERELKPPPPPPVPFLPSEPRERSRHPDNTEKKAKTWTQVPDYFADDFSE